MKKLQKDTRVYYTGDMANQPSEGTVCRVNESKFYGETYDIVFDDGRLFRGVLINSFSPGPGQRFYLLSEWEEKRQAKIQAFIEKYS